MSRLFEFYHEEMSYEELVWRREQEINAAWEDEEEALIDEDEEPTKKQNPA